MIRLVIQSTQYSIYYTRIWYYIILIAVGINVS